MSARKRSSTASAIALTAAVTASAALLLTGCGPSGTPKAQAAPSGTATGSGPAQPSSSPTDQPTASASPSPAGPTAAPTPFPTTSTTPVSGSPVSLLNGTGSNGLTISDGTDYVVMNGTRVDFGTIVRDLAWNAAGTKAAFIDGSGNLVVSNPDGSGKTVVARNPGNQVWSHPTWVVHPAGYTDPTTNAPVGLYFAASVNGVSRLEAVSATAVDATPAIVQIQGQFGTNAPKVPTTGNAWPTGGGAHTPMLAYANSDGEVYLRDTFLRLQSSKDAPGSEPALSPSQTATEIVFVRSVDGHDHLFEEGPNQTTAEDLTPGATTDYTEPTWSPDGRTIAARTPQGIVTLAADGSGKPVLVSGYTGLPAYRA